MKTISTKDWADPGFPLALSWGELFTDFPVHAHGYDELMVISKGTARHVAEGVEFDIGEGDVFAVKVGQTHGFMACERLQVLNIQYEPRLLAPKLTELRTLSGFNALFLVEPSRKFTRQFQGHLRLGPAELKLVVACFQELNSELSVRAPGWRVMAESLFFWLVTFLSRCYEERPRPDGEAMLALGKTIARLGKGFDQPVTLAELAKSANMSINSFLRAFKAVTGQSPIEYLLRERLRHARGMLLDSRRGLAEIAAACGFNDSNYFSRQFKKCYGASPERYRKGTF